MDIVPYFFFCKSTSKSCGNWPLPKAGDETLGSSRGGRGNLCHHGISKFQHGMGTLRECCKLQVLYFLTANQLFLISNMMLFGRFEHYNPRSWGKRPFSCRGHVEVTLQLVCQREWVPAFNFVFLNLLVMYPLSHWYTPVFIQFHTQCGLTSGSVVWEHFQHQCTYILRMISLYVLNLPWAFSKSPNNSHIGPQQLALQHPSHLDRGGEFPRWEKALPVPALRSDLGALLTAGRFLPRFAAAGPWGATQLTDPFAETVQRCSKWVEGCKDGEMVGKMTFPFGAPGLRLT